jgi:DNA processing protein
MQATMTEKQAMMILNALPNVGPISVKKLLKCFGSPQKVLQVNGEELEGCCGGINRKAIESLRHWQTLFNVEREDNWLNKRPADFISVLDPRYPPLLKEIYDPPTGFYCYGNDAFNDGKRVVAIIGSRQPTLYGIKVAQDLAAELAQRNFCVVSGLARGIDSAVHESVLKNNGKTIGVLGCGLDIIYPPENKDLYEGIAHGGGAVITECRFSARVDRLSFPRRNRIIAGLCELVLVVESDHKGGSMITANFAVEQGRLVGAIPGRIDQTSSNGCHALLKNGATLITCVEDILEELNYNEGQRQLNVQLDKRVKEERQSGYENLSEQEAIVWKYVKESGKGSIDAICEALKMPIQAVNSLVIMLELKHYLAKKIDGTFEATN